MADSAPGSLLDIPDEPPRRVRGVVAALVGAAVVIVGGVVLARTFALGGTSRPWLAVQAVVALPAMVVAWLLAGAHPHRTWLAVGAMVVGLATQPVAAAGVVPSAARLAQTVDAIGLPGEITRDVRVGNGRCRPSCSELRRTAVAKGIAYAKARAQVEGILRARGFKVTLYGHRPGEPERIDALSDDLLAQFELRQIALDQTRIAAVWIARGPAADSEVG